MFICQTKKRNRKKRNQENPLIKETKVQTTSAADLPTKTDETCFYAHKLLYNNNLIIKQCSSWLSEEEGLKNMKKHT